MADCCDGSDEYDGNTKCPNTCWEAGKVAREKLRKKIATYQEGVTIRRQEIEKAKLTISKEEAELEKLKAEEKILKGLVEKLKGTFFFPFRGMKSCLTFSDLTPNPPKTNLKSYAVSTQLWKPLFYACKYMNAIFISYVVSFYPMLISLWRVVIE